ncbi:MAG: SBBP repeat-containing protein [Bacteroidales bacterium]
MKDLIKIKGMLIVSLFICFTNDVDSQTNFIYGKQFGSVKDGVAFNPVADKSGNVYIAGNTSGALAGQSYGKTDGFVSKCDSAGNTIWTKQFGTAEDDLINWITLDQAGNAYVTGCTNGVFGEKNYGKEDIVVAKFDTNGNLEWQKQFGSDSTDVGNMVYVDNQGYIYLSAATRGTMDQLSYGGADCVLLKLDGKGNILWTKQFGTPKGDECQGITGDGTDIYVCGYTFGDLAAKNKGSLDAFIGKFNDKGEQVKLFQFGTAGFDMASHITVDKEENIYIGGSTGGDLDSKNLGEGDSFLSKFDKNFGIIWTQQFGTEKWDGINGMALNEKTSGNIVVSGCQHWPSCQSFVRMYSKEGRLLWVNNYTANGKNGGTCGKGVCIDHTGNIYHSGNTGGNLFKSIEKPEGHDMFLLKLSMCNSQPDQ